MKYALIVNPMANSGKNKEVIPKIKGFFARRKLDFTVYPTKKSGDGTIFAKEAAKKGYEVVIAGGGDGTINEVINGIAGTKSALGVIPLGTANVLALELKISKDPIEACKAIITQKPVPIDIGVVNGRYFLSWAGIGLHSHIIGDTEKTPLKKLFGTIAYGIAGAVTVLTYSPSRMSVNADGKNYQGYFILVGNIKYYGGKYKVLPKAQSNDGLLDIVIFKKKALLHNFKYTLAMGLGQHVNYTDVDYLQAKNIRIDSFQPALIHADAELVSKTPAIITTKTKFLKIIA